MIGNRDWRRYIYTLDVDPGKKVKKIDYSLVADKVSGNIQLTDLQFQEGKSISANIPATQDILDPVDFNIDERAFIDTVSNLNPGKHGNQPIYHEKVRNRFFNVVGRGHNVISIPNVFHEDYTFPVVTTGLDIELRAKEDFDLLRIRTNDGDHVEDRHYAGIPELQHHPLNYQYTREFYFDGAKAGDLIQLKATIRSAKINSSDVPLKSRVMLINGHRKEIDRQRFMLAPSGSFRIGVEFYKQVEQEFENDTGEKEKRLFLKDVGIGYYGFAELNQWTYGVSKL